MKENKELELKEEFTKNFLKTVSAFANYGGGVVLFGVRNDGQVIGNENTDELKLQIENSINDSISLQPQYTITEKDNGVIELRVFEGFDKPYMYRSKAYKRSDTATVEVDRFELSRLVLEGKNLDYEDLPADNQDLSFTYLEKTMLEIIDIEEVNLDILKTLDLYNSKTGYNKAAELVADSNKMPGIDIARFGDNINIILGRYELMGKSILAQYHEAIELYKHFYQYEEIEGFKRVKKELIPQEAYRELVANAIVYRTWDINANIRISFYSDRIEVNSPGGLPRGVNEETYLSGNLSILRNPILAGLFYRLDYIERFGTGVKRIKKEYYESLVKPVFKISQDYISVTLPVVKHELELEGDQAAVYKVMQGRGSMTSSEISKEAGFGATKTLELLTKLVEEGYVTKLGAGRGTSYITSASVF